MSPAYVFMRMCMHARMYLNRYVYMYVCTINFMAYYVVYFIHNCNNANTCMVVYMYFNLLAPEFYI